MRKYIGLILVAIILCSCGNKSTTNEGAAVKTTESYITEIDNNSKLVEKLTEGALTDNEGFNDVGRFKYSVRFDKESGELFRIKNIEISEKTIEERYYFNNHQLVCILSSTKGQPDKKIYTRGFRKVISKSNITEFEEKILLDKAKRFKKAHYRIDD